MVQTYQLFCPQKIYKKRWSNASQLWITEARTLVIYFVWSSPHKHPTNTLQTPHRSSPHNTSQTPHKHPTNTSQTPHKHPTNTPQTPHKHLTSTPQTPQKHLTNTSQTPHKHLTNTSQTPHKHPTNTPQNLTILHITTPITHLTSLIWCYLRWTQSRCFI